MKNVCIALAAGLSCLAFGASASAATVYDWSISSGLYNGNGTFTTNDTPASGSSFLLTDIDGLLNGSEITGLLPIGSIGGNDNLFNPGGPFLDGSGISFSTALDQFNLFHGEAAHYALFGFNSTFDTDVTFTAQLAAAAVPEPATWGLMLAGFGAAGYALRRRKVSYRQAA